jgi:hypothetical protein
MRSAENAEPIASSRELHASRRTVLQTVRRNRTVCNLDIAQRDDLSSRRWQSKGNSYNPLACLNGSLPWSLSQRRVVYQGPEVG